MTFQQGLASWMNPTPTSVPVSSPPEIGSKAPSSEKLPFPRPDGKPVIVAFLRHCGCPFAEKTFLSLRASAAAHPSITHIAISHSSPDSTETWTTSLGGTWDVDVLIDESREIYAQWGLGTSSAWHVLNPWSMWNVMQLGRQEGIWNRETSSGNRWQTAGRWAVDGEGKVVWGGPEGGAGEGASEGFEKAVEVLGVKEEKPRRMKAPGGPQRAYGRAVE